ncbi:ankyrin repeat-containing domain protein [Zychaea mexicana]|uniref:ankyrin repeat-containing domain protein n=1 Tax=Zychaea mexicana TaxID=64656 RepID=UPI0022FE1927|nr:ankyrin repeat-containing domain protein [Zychaea mexicana]KAI9499643.1 ankyrin repeat-containing domain protein [Zychaea mexicana]
MRPIRSAKEVLYELLPQIDAAEVRKAMRSEIKRMITDHERLVTMLQQRSQMLEHENDELKLISSEHQRRYEKAVREMQFFRRKFDRAVEVHKQLQLSAYDPVIGPTELPLPSTPRTKSTMPSRSSSTSTSSSASQYWANANNPMGTIPGPPLEPAPPVPRLRQNSIATSVHSSQSTSTDGQGTSTNGYTGASLIQQRRVDPLIFGGSDGLWETIAKSKGSDVTVEKIISNFLRRGGSPNTSKQSPSANAVKYGYGMIHALIVTKAPGSLDLLLQQGANPNVMTLSQIEDEKVTPCYLAASVGWLIGLQKLVQAGGDLMAARGAGVKNKTVLHVAAEHCHAAVVEYIVNVTQGGLNLEEDSNGATVLHYACASGHTDLVSFLARSCQIPVNQPDHRGELPLHWAARHGRLEVVTLLVERCGCDFNSYVPRKVGTTLDLAKAGGQRRLVDYLKGLGALTAKKMDKRREEELAREVPGHLESTLTRNGFFGEDI